MEPIVMTPTIEKEAPPLCIEPDGTMRVGPSRITLDQLVESFLSGQTLEAFVEAHPTVELADAYGAIAYYLAHRDELDPYLKERDRRADELLATIRADPRNRELREK